MKELHPVKISILSDNVAGRWCRAEHGLSYLIEADRTILLDTGSSDIFLHNARIMNIDIRKTDTIVLSHGHDDHTTGLRLLPRRKLICHPDVFLKRYRKSNHTTLGMPWTEEEITAEFDLVTSREPVKISEQVYFLGEIPRITSFENKKTAFIKEDGTEDFVMDDSGLAIMTSKGLIVVSGCAHSGICNMTAHAQNVTGIANVYMVIGGFHLQYNDEVTQKTIGWMQARNVKRLVPSHCTALPALAAIYNACEFLQIKTGNIIDLD